MAWALVNASDCTNIELKFPLTVQGELPAIALNQKVLFSSKSSQVLNWLNSPSPEFWSGLPTMSWIQKALLFEKLQKVNSDHAASFQNHFRINVDEASLYFVLEAGLENYCHDRDLQSADIAILKFAGPDLLPVFRNEKLKRFSKSEFTAASELIIELIHQSKTNFDELNAILDLSPEKILEALRVKRFPVASNKDLENQTRLKKVNLGQGVQTKWVRQGDRSGVEIKFFATQEKELRRQIDQLSRVSVVFENET